MLKKLGKTLTNNFSLKILAVLCAMVLWLVVVNIDDPTRKGNFSTTVTLKNTEYMETLDKYYEVVDDSTTVSFTVSAKRSIYEKLSSADFSATADMEKIEYNEKTDTYQIPISISPIRYSASQVDIVSTTRYVTVSLEELTSKKVMITANTEGTVGAGCALGDISIESTNVVTVSGPESIVEKVSSAVATINVEGMTTDIVDNVIPVLYDSDGNVVDTSKLKMSVDVVAVSARILGTKEVAISVDTTGEPAEGYEVTGIEFSPETVEIKGVASTLNTVTTIEIPVEVLDISGTTEDFIKEIDITSYLPDGISLVDNSSNKVTVTVRVEQVITKDFDVPVENLTLTNVASNLNAVYEVDTVKVTISGLASDMNRLNASDITGTVDASGLSRGVHMVQVSWDLDDTIYTVKTVVTASVNLTEKSEENDDAENTGNGTGTGTTGGTTAGEGSSSGNENSTEAGSTGTTGGTTSGTTSEESSRGN